MVDRLIPWLDREMTVMIGDYCDEGVITALNLIVLHPIRCQFFVDQIFPYTRQFTLHFVHEFYNFAISPLDMIAYDREVSYTANEYRPFSPDANIQVSTTAISYKCGMR